MWFISFYAVVSFNNLKKFVEENYICHASDGTSNNSSLKIIYV